MRKSKFKHRQSRHVFFKCILIMLGLAAGVMFWQKPRFEPDELVQNSIIQEKVFDKIPQHVQAGDLTAWLLEDHTVPLISVHFLFQNAGSAHDPINQEGRALLTAETLALGAGQNDRFAFWEILEKNGVMLSFNAKRDDFSGALTTPSANKETAFQLLRDVFCAPRFSEKDVKISKMQILEALKRQKEHPENELSLEFSKVLYANHPYGRNPLGKEEDLKKLTPKDLKAFVKEALAQDNLIVGVAGDITAEETAKMLQELFGHLPKISKSVPLMAPVIQFNRPPVHIERDVAQSAVRFAAKGVTRISPDFYPLYIANHIFGGSGLTSRLSLSARENEGLTYGIGTYLSTDENAPLIVGSFSATPENYEKALKILHDKWLDLAQKGVSAKELETARNYLLASYNLRFSSVEEIAEMLIGMQKYDLGIDFLQKRNTYIKNVRLEDVNRVATTYFQDLPLEVNIGKIKE